MNLQNMEYLIEILNCGSISAAAKHLFVTQPYLSKVLRETEKEYGLTIFTRGKNGITDGIRTALSRHERDLIEHANILRPPLRNIRKLTACGSPPAAVPRQRCLYPHGELSCGHAVPFFLPGNDRK